MLKRETVGEAAGKVADAMGLDAAQREPTWAECGLEQKVERVREALLHCEGVLAGVEATSAEASRIAKAHEHSSLGAVMVPIIERSPLWDNQARYGVRHIFSRLR